MEVVPGELSGHVDDLTVLTPASLLYQGLYHAKVRTVEGGGGRGGRESISRPPGLAWPGLALTLWTRLPSPFRLSLAPWTRLTILTSYMQFSASFSRAYKLVCLPDLRPISYRICFLFLSFFIFASRSRYSRILSSCRVSFDYPLVPRSVSSLKKGKNLAVAALCGFLSLGGARGGGGDSEHEITTGKMVLFWTFFLFINGDWRVSWKSWFLFDGRHRVIKGNLFGGR